MIDDTSWVDVMIAAGGSTFAVFIADFLRRLLFPWIKLGHDLIRRKYDLPPD